jgi:hypothetical protein
MTRQRRPCPKPPTNQHRAGKADELSDEDASEAGDYEERVALPKP